MGTVAREQQAAMRLLHLYPFLLLALHLNVFLASPVEDQISPQGHLSPGEVLSGRSLFNNFPRRYFSNNGEGNQLAMKSPRQATFERMTKSLAESQDGILFQRLTKRNNPDDEIFERLTKRDDEEEVFQRLTKKKKKNAQDQLSHFLFHSYIPFQKMRYGLRPLANHILLSSCQKLFKEKHKII